MVASTVKSENVTNIEASTPVTLTKKDNRETVVIDQIAATTTSLDEVNDLILFGPVNSTDVITDLEVLNDDLDSDACPTLAVNVGLYYSGIGGNQSKDGKSSGDVVDADCFASAVTTLQAANVTYASVRYEAANITTVDQEAWQVAGLTEDPGGLLYVGMAVTTAAATAAAGDIVVRVTRIG